MWAGYGSPVYRRTETGKLGLLRGDLNWIVRKCLEKELTRRYETANGLAADIRCQLSEVPVAARSLSTVYRMWEFVNRSRDCRFDVGVALLLGFGGTTAGLLWALDQKARSTIAEKATQREHMRANEVKRLITELLANVNPALAQGADIFLLKRIRDDTARRLARDKSTDELVAAELHNVVGVVDHDLGLWDEAELHIAIALEILKPANVAHD